MGFLENNWNNILPPINEKGLDSQCKATGYIRPWSHDKANMYMICRAISILRPMNVIELGTFEAMGTKRIADELEKNKIKSNFWTFDEGTVTLTPWPKSAHEDMIESWKKVVVIRAERIAFPYKYIILEYVEGLTINTLPDKLQEIGEWDFCFQDSVHSFNDILDEWKLLEPHSKVGSVIVFDDILINHEWLNYFPKNNQNWDYRHTELGRSQLWAERIY